MTLPALAAIALTIVLAVWVWVLHQRLQGQRALPLEPIHSDLPASALAQAEAKFATAFHFSPCAMTITRLSDGQFVDVNDSFERQTGYSRAEVVGHTIEEFGMWIDPSDREAIGAALALGRRVGRHELRFRTKAGLVATALYSADLITMGDVPCVLAIAEDITVRREVEATQRAILKALPDWVFLLDNDGVFLDFHARDRRHLLAPPEVFLGRNVREVLPPDLADGLIGCFEQARRSGDPAVYEYSVGIDGEPRFYEARVVQSDSDKLLSVVRDITERKRAELEAVALRDELAHLGRVTSLEALTGTLAHEINQPLTALIANADTGLRIIGQRSPDLAELGRTLNDIIAEGQRAGHVLKRVRSLLKKESARYEGVDLNQTIREVVRLVQGTAVGRRIQLDVDLAPAGRLVLGDRVQLQQVVLNLLLNAFDAVEDGDPDARRVTLRTSASDDRAVIAVIDRGAGLADADLSRMFEPFYTTKRDGMGLGLSICQAIVGAHGGALRAERNPDRGMTVLASFPAMSPDDLVGALRVQGIS